MASEEKDKQIGKIIDRKYKIISKLGGGGMGMVYEAEHQLMERRVALKMLHKHHIGDDEQSELYFERFKREARTASQIKHPSMVAIYDFGIFKGNPYLVMELVKGRTLKEVSASEGPFPIDRVWNIFSQVCGAVQAAHSLDIVHRDLKPDNIMITKEADGFERALVLDFGIAKALGSSQNQDVTMTQAGTAVGTPRYMSPEQVLGQDLDNRSDLYSLGIVLYEMLTGDVPFKADSSMELMMAHVNSDPIPVRTLKPELNIPKPVEAVVMKALQKPVDKRQQTVGELAQDLEASVLASGQPRRKLSRAKTSANLGPAGKSMSASAIPMVGMALVVLLAGAYFLMGDSKEIKEEPDKLAMLHVDDEESTIDSGSNGSSSESEKSNSNTSDKANPTDNSSSEANTANSEESNQQTDNQKSASGTASGGEVLAMNSGQGSQTEEGNTQANQQAEIEAAKAQAEAERIKAEQIAAEEKRKAEEAAMAEQERLKAEALAKAEADRIAAEEAERKRLEDEAAAMQEAERIKAENERLAKEQAEKERLAKEKAAKEQAEKERLAKEKATKEKAEKERLAKEKAAKQKAEKERLAKEKSQADKKIAKKDDKNAKEADKKAKPANKIAALKSLNIKQLIKKLSDEDRTVRETAARLLQTKGQAPVKPLIKALKNSNSRVRFWAAFILGELRSQEAVEPLISTLDDKSGMVSQTAEQALNKIGGNRARNELKNRFPERYKKKSSGWSLF